MITLARPPTRSTLKITNRSFQYAAPYLYGTNSPLIFVSLVRHSLLHFHLSHMAYHHHPPYHLHDQYSHLFLLVLSFIRNLKLGSLPNHFLHRPSPFLPDRFHGLTDHLTFYSAQRLDLFAWCVRLSRLLVGFRTHLKSLHFLILCCGQK